MLRSFWGLALAAMLLMSGCGGGKRDEEASSDAPIILRSTTIADSQTDVSVDSGFSGRLESVEVRSLQVDEDVSVLNVTFNLQGGPNLELVAYRCSFRAPDNSLAGAEAGQKGTGPAGVSYVLFPTAVRLVIPYEAIASVTNFTGFRVNCMTDARAGNYQAFDRVPVTFVPWRVVRAVSFGLGPYSQRTMVAEDACCDQQYMALGREGNYSDGPSDLRIVWVWHDAVSLFLEVNASAAPKGKEELSVRYGVKQDHQGAPSQADIVYHYSSDQVTKNRAATTATASRTSNNGVRLNLPWSILNDRVNEEKIMLTATLWGKAPDGAVLADPAPQVAYIIKR